MLRVELWPSYLHVSTLPMKIELPVQLSFLLYIRFKYHVSPAVFFLSYMRCGCAGVKNPWSTDSTQALLYVAIVSPGSSRVTNSILLREQKPSEGNSWAAEMVQSVNW